MTVYYLQNALIDISVLFPKINDHASIIICDVFAISSQAANVRPT